MARDASSYIKTAVIRRLVADFNRSNANLDSNPLFIQDRPIPGIEAPYVYVDVTSVNEMDKTKNGSSKEYRLRLMTVVESSQETSGEVLRNDVMSECVRVLDAPEAAYLDLNQWGYNVYVQNATVNDRRVNNANFGKTFFLGTVGLVVRAEYVGHSIEQPVGNQSLTFTGFEFTPSSNRLEEWDAGSIRVDDSHADTNGWTFDSVSVAKATGKTDGDLEGNVLTVESDDTSLGLTSTFTFERGEDSTTVTDTDNFTRIKSLRYGSIPGDSKPVFTDDLADTTGLRSLEQWNDGRRTIRYGTTNPHNTDITIVAQAGDWIYIIVDENRTLTAVEEDVFSQNILTDVFDAPYNVGGYKVYMATNARNYNVTYNLTLEV